MYFLQQFHIIDDKKFSMVFIHALGEAARRKKMINKKGIKFACSSPSENQDIYHHYAQGMTHGISFIQNTLTPEDGQ